MIIPKYAAKTAGSVILKQRVVLNKETKNVRRKQSVRIAAPVSNVTKAVAFNVSPMTIVALVRNAVRPLVNVILS